MRNNLIQKYSDFLKLKYGEIDSNFVESTVDFFISLNITKNEDFAAFGRIYGKLTVIGKYEGYPIKLKCKCECGNVKDILEVNLRQNRTKSCGCLKNSRKVL